MWLLEEGIVTSSVSSVPTRSTESLPRVAVPTPTNKTNERTNARSGCEANKSSRFVTRTQAYEISSLVKIGALRAAISTAAKEAAQEREVSSVDEVLRRHEQEDV